MRMRMDPARVRDDPLLLKVLTFLVKSVLEELLLESHVFTETGGTAWATGGEISEVFRETDPLSGWERGESWWETWDLAVFALQ